MPVHDQVWVTLVNEDKSHLDALVLLESLKRCMTNRKIVALLGPNVSDFVREKLEQKFDGVVGVGGNEKGCFGILNIISGWLKESRYEKCVFLNAGLLVLRNCDELFEHGNGFAAIGQDIDVLVLEFGELCHKVGEGTDVQDLISKGFNPLCYQYNYAISNTTECDNELIIPKIVKFSEHPSKLGSCEFGPFQKEVIEYWNKINAFVKENSAAQNENQTSFQTVNNKGQEPIAVIGMSCRFPGANNIQEFWDVLLQGEAQLHPVPENRWRPEDGVPSVTQEERSLPAGFLKCPVDEFDSKFFGMSPAELDYLDPQQRLSLEVAWEALEDAGINPDTLKGTDTGIFTGIWKKDYYDLLSDSGFRQGEFYRSYMGNAFACTAGRLAFMLGVTGLNVASESGCSSSAVALGLACESLQSHKTSLALACGANLLLQPYPLDSWKSVISLDGKCLTFDADANGFVRAEGISVLILKRLSQAVQDNDKIHGLIRGYGQTQEGLSKSMGTPTAKCEALAIELALKDAGVEPKEVSYVEAHGTGTPVGDPIEMEAITEVYSRGRKRSDPLIVGSVKTIIGHSESCSGLAGVIKTLLSLKNETIPPHINLKKLNPLINLDKLPAIIPQQAMPWKKSENTPRIAGLSCYGISGTDTHIILQEAPEIFKVSKFQAKPKEIFTLSAKSKEALNELVEKYKTFLEQNPTLSLADVCYTVNTGRAHFPHRIAVICSNVADLVKKLEKRSFLQGQILEQEQQPKLCFLFPGQGCQYHNMGKLMYDTNPVFKHSFDHCAQVFKTLYKIDIKQHVWAEEASPELNVSLNSQCAIFGVEYALLKVWESWGIKPDCVLGHSFGEVCATLAAGGMSLEDTVKNVVQRGYLMDTMPQGKMLAVKVSEKEMQQLLEEVPKTPSFWIDIATLNSPEQTVVSGREESISKLAEFCTQKGIKTHILDSVQAFHSRDMDGMLQVFKEAQVKGGVKVEPNLTCEYVSAVYGRKLAEGETIEPEYWLKHVREAVRFLDASTSVYAMGYRLFLEVGPQPVLSALLTRNTEGQGEQAVQCLPSMRKKNEDEWTTMLSTLGSLYTKGVAINWYQFHKFYPGSKVRLPYYAFQRKRYWFTPPKQRLTMGGGKMLHPLVGVKLNNPTSNKIYQNYVELSANSYLKDHCIGKYVIFPGAGYLEMCLASGHASSLAAFEDFYAPLAPIVVEDLVISAPMLVEDGSQMQTVISGNESKDDDQGWTNIKIYSEADGKWTQHIRAKFSPVVTDVSVGSSTMNELEAIQRRLPKDFKDTADFYKELEGIGLPFGSTFKSLQQFWKSEHEEEFLVKVVVPTEGLASYLCHPILLDAILQSFILKREGNLKQLEVPVVIDKYVWLGRSNSSVNYVHVNHNVATLFDDNGKKLGVMTGVMLVQTDVQSITKSLEKQKIHLPMFLEDNWKVVKPLLELTKEDLATSVEKPTWLILTRLAELEQKLKQDLTKKLEECGRNVVEIKSGANFNPENKEEMKKAVLTNIGIEGIIYLLGLERKDTLRAQREYTQGYLNLEQIIQEMKIRPKLFTITKGAVYLGDQSTNQLPHPATLWGMSKTFRSEHPSIFCKCIDLDPDSEGNLEAGEIFRELWSKEKDYQIAYRQGTRNVLRMSQISATLSPLSLPNSQRYALVLPSTKAISDLKFGLMQKQPLARDMIEVEVKAAGLNFRDILSVIKPDAQFDNSNTVAADYSGVVVRVGEDVTKFRIGDAVLGCNWGGAALPSHISTKEDIVTKLPDKMTFAEGATLATAFVTAYYCLVEVADLKKDETILIHTASGAVGICAIQIAQNIGVNIIATAGNKRKRTFLKTLGVQHVFNSRSLDFGEDVEKLTEGKGVHVVLNSLTSPGFKEASLSCCARNGRFVEMSKLNIWEQSDVLKLRQDVQYTVVDLSESSHSTWKMLFKNLSEHLTTEKLKPITYTRFDALNIREALNYLQKAKHIGKVVCVMPETKMKNGELQVKTDLFNERSSYLITGGLGGIGLEVAKWMAESGAKFIILCGRSEPEKNSKAYNVIQKLKSGGKFVIFRKTDVGNKEECKELLSGIDRYPPLRGVMHAAGCLSDGLIADQTWEKFDVAFNGKVVGAWNLHELTKNYNLEHFVVYSSIAAVVGAIGQSNHAAGNAFLDSLTHYRHALGLPSTSVNWGQWGQVGIAAELEIPGMTPFTPTQALNALEVVMKLQKLQTAIVDGDVAVWKLLFSWASNYMEEVKVTTSSSSSGGNTTAGNFEVNSANFWKDVDNAGAEAEKVIQKYVASMLSYVLKLDDSEELDENQNFQDLGLDSLMMVEFKNILQTLLGSKVNFSLGAISDCPTVRLLTTKLMELISEEGKN